MRSLMILIIHTWTFLYVLGSDNSKYCNSTQSVFGYDCWCNGFDTVAQLQAPICQDKVYTHITLEPSVESSIIFDKHILNLLQYYSNSIPPLRILYLYNFAGIDLAIYREPYYTQLLGITGRSSYIKLTRLRFNLYLDGQPLQMSFDKNAPPGSRCNESVFVNMFETGNSALSLNRNNMQFVDPRFSTTNLCPFIFKNFYTNTLVTYGSIFQFDTTEYSNLDTLNSIIQEISLFNFYKLNVDSSVLHPYVLGRSLEQLLFTRCSLNKIQTDVFKSCKNLKSLSLTINNLRFFLHTNGIEWINYLNMGANFTQSNDQSSYFFLKFKTVVLDQYLYQQRFFPYLEYSFPNEDYCLFRDFPHQNLIIPVISRKTPIHWSCTIQILMKKYPYYYNLGIFDKEIEQIFSFFDHDYTWNYCNITCNISNNMPSYQAHYFDLYDLKNEFLFWKKWLLSIFGPVASLLGCITNILVIFTIKSAARIAKKRSKKPETGDQKHALVDPKQPFFVYMLINSIINLTNCVMYFFYYLIKCDIKITGDRGLVSPVCFNETLSINITASILKLLSNFTFLQMSVNRYALVGKDHYKFLLKIANMRIRKYIGWGILVSMALSVIVYFQQQFFSSSFRGKVFSEDYYSNNYFWYSFGDESIEEVHEVYNFTLTKLRELPYLSGFTMVHDLFSYFLFCVVTTVIDIMTVVRLKRVLNEKKQMLAKATSQAKSTKKNKAQSDEIEKSEKKSIAMIVLNSLAIFILRFPELISVIFFYDLLLNQNSDYTYKMFCYSYRQCLAVLDLSNLFYLFSLSLNFIFYYLFNLSFKITFNEATDLFKKFIKKLECKKQ